MEDVVNAKQQNSGAPPYEMMAVLWAGADRGNGDCAVFIPSPARHASTQPSTNLGQAQSEVDQCHGPAEQ